MICRRHDAVAQYREHGRVYCVRCFTEALADYDAMIHHFDRPLTLTDIIRRLEGKPNA